MDVIALQQAKRFAVDLAPMPGGYVTGRPPGTRRAAFTFGNGGSQGTSTAYTDVNERRPFKMSVTPSRYRIHIRNFDGKTPGASAITGAITIAGIYIGTHSLNGSGGWTGSFTATPTQVVGATSTPSDGSEYTSDWITNAGEITADRDLLFSIGWSCTGGQTIAKSNGSVIYTAGASANAGDTAVPGGSSTITLVPLGGVWIEYEFIGTNPVGLWIGDSLTERYTNTGGKSWNTAYPNRHAQRSRSCAIIGAYGGSKATDWTSSSTFKWTKWATSNGYTIDYAVVLLGTNDLLASDTAANIAGYFTSIISNLRTTLGIKRVYLGTVPPGSTITAGKETERGTLNTTLRGLPYETLGCFDFSAALQDPTTFTATPLAAWAESDGLHPNASGSDRMASAIPGRLA